MNDLCLQRALANSCLTIKPDHEIERSQTPEGALVLWGYRSKFWPTRAVLKVRFLNGDRQQQLKMTERLKRVDEWCGLAFKVVTSGPAEVRIAFNLNSGHWSYVGDDSLTIRQQFQTMNIGLRSRDSNSEWDRVGIHETLHAIGFNHEHQHPRGKIPWDVAKVYEFYGRTQGWSRAEIRAQVLDRESPMGMVGTNQPDKLSIMMYPIERSLLTDASFAVGWNTKPSVTDLETLKSVYPL